MDLNEYSEAALKTESKISEINTNKDRIFSILEIMICAGNMLDDLKKNIFANKEIDSSKYFTHAAGLMSAYRSLDLISNEKILDQNSLIDDTLDVDPRIFHGVIGIATESTEMLEALYQYILTGELDKINLAEEVSDNNWYEAILMDALGQDWSKNMAKNIEKLKNRYKSNTFSDKESAERDLKAERKILES